MTSVWEKLTNHETHDRVVRVGRSEDTQVVPTDPMRERISLTPERRARMFCQLVPLV